MFSFLTTTVVIVSICLGIYKLFELYARRKERIMIIEKMFEKISDISMGGKLDVDLGVNLFKKHVSKFTSLRWGAFLIGIGLGAIVGHFISDSSFNNYGNDFQYDFINLFYFIIFSSIIMGGGFGLLIAFFVEQRCNNKEYLWKNLTNEGK